MSDPRSVRVAFPAERDAAAWEQRYDRGEVPGRWPYGLDLLDARTTDLRAIAVPEPPRYRRALGMLGLLAATPGKGPITLSWDENTARRALLTGARGSHYAGVIWLTDMIARSGSARYARLRSVLRRLDGIWVLSRAQVDPLREFLGPGGPPVGFVRFGVDTDFFRAAPPPVEPLVLSVGGDRDRDADTLFAALAIVRRHRPDVRIVVQTSSSAPPPPGVEVLPRVAHRELGALYRSASVVAIATHPNLHFSGMTVSLEALATGRPVVVTETPGMRDYLSDDSATLTPAGEPAALADGVLRLLTDQAQAHRMGAEGRRSVEAGMTTQHLISAIADLAGL